MRASPVDLSQSMSAQFRARRSIRICAGGDDVSEKGEFSWISGPYAPAHRLCIRAENERRTPYSNSGVAFTIMIVYGAPSGATYRVERSACANVDIVTLLAPKNLCPWQRGAAPDIRGEGARKYEGEADE